MRSASEAGVQCSKPSTVVPSGAATESGRSRRDIVKQSFLSMVSPFMTEMGKRIALSRLRSFTLRRMAGKNLSHK